MGDERVMVDRTEIQSSFGIDDVSIINPSHPTMPG